MKRLFRSQVYRAWHLSFLKKLFRSIDKGIFDDYGDIDTFQDTSQNLRHYSLCLYKASPSYCRICMILGHLCMNSRLERISECSVEQYSWDKTLGKIFIKKYLVSKFCILYLIGYTSFNRFVFIYKPKILDLDFRIWTFVSELLWLKDFNFR